MTVPIRPHHLLCMLTYLGKGYTPDFVSNYSRIIKRLNAGEEVELINGPDEICLPMLSEHDCHCHNESVQERDVVALLEIGKALDSNLKVGERFVVSEEMLSALRTAFTAGKIRTACEGCEWQDLCTGIAQNKFSGCRLASR
jgi:uncharacterized protein